MQRDREEGRTAEHAGHAVLGGHDVRRVALIDRDICARTAGIGVRNKQARRGTANREWGERGVTYPHRVRHNRPRYRALRGTVSTPRTLLAFTKQSRALTRGGRPHDKDLLPGVVLRRVVRGRVRDLPPELLPPRDLGDERVVSAQADREHDVADMEDACGAVGARHGDVPLVVPVLRCVQDRRGRPHVQLERLRVRLEPVRELVRGGVDGPRSREAARPPCIRVGGGAGGQIARTRREYSRDVGQVIVP